MAELKHKIERSEYRLERFREANIPILIKRELRILVGLKEQLWTPLFS